MVSFLGFIIGASIWLLIECLGELSWPTSPLTYSLPVIFVMFIAYKRGEFNDLWGGHFHDNELLENIVRRDF